MKKDLGQKAQLAYLIANTDPAKLPKAILGKWKLTPRPNPKTTEAAIALRNAIRKICVQYGHDRDPWGDCQRCDQ
jgi:hypothetical protein